MEQISDEKKSQTNKGFENFRENLHWNNDENLQELKERNYHGNDNKTSMQPSVLAYVNQVRTL